jgi:hypothetical protein
VTELEALAKARELVKDYLHSMGGQECGYAYEEHEMILAKNISDLLLQAAGTRAEVSDVYYNENKFPIRIETTNEYGEWTKNLVMPGDGIDVSILGLKRRPQATVSVSDDARSLLSELKGHFLTKPESKLACEYVERIDRLLNTPQDSK